MIQKDDLCFWFWSAEAWFTLNASCVSQLRRSTGAATQSARSCPLTSEGRSTRRTPCEARHKSDFFLRPVCPGRDATLSTGPEMAIDKADSQNPIYGSCAVEKAREAGTAAHTLCDLLSLTGLYQLCFPEISNCLNIIQFKQIQIFVQGGFVQLALA